MEAQKGVAIVVRHEEENHRVMVVATEETTMMMAGVDHRAGHETVGIDER